MADKPESMEPVRERVCVTFEDGTERLGFVRDWDDEEKEGGSLRCE